MRHLDRQPWRTWERRSVALLLATAILGALLAAGVSAAPVSAADLKPAGASAVTGHGDSGLSPDPAKDGAGAGGQAGLPRTLSERAATFGWFEKPGLLLLTLLLLAVLLLGIATVMNARGRRDRLA